MIYNWSKLTQTEIYRDILSQWESLVNNKALKEKDYQEFLRTHPAIFLTIIESYLVISKLKLGSDYETDFVVVREGYSDGTIYELIEIESPHTKLFDSSGKLSSKFNSALQQIRDWKRWLIDNKSQFKKILPTINTKVLQNSRLQFKIIIGRRTDDLLELEKRRQIAETEKIEIISFDRLTDIAKRRRNFQNESTISSAQMHFNVTYEQENELANPFFECITDSEWRKMCYKGGAHFHTNQLENILRTRTYNEHFDKFRNLIF
ncbi:Shedu anti-phage system protein SduA domain-containing protein [Chitinophaga sp. CF418]|uniref:Shedu anti-phage system protein SduA domain-containing protein n=1 Tax=Chitinophaga sp. CF418 TaxID=1855287 RepID=UPI000915D94C|nr:Shedu anti-phage system protein SduA domain-containing protein [Chitinophaga sp. CF418]SHN45108.1 protein of unknown function [Chitinophaga sp. CF418]